MAFNLSSELVFTNVLNVPRPRRHPDPQRRPQGRAPDRGRRRALHLQPRARRRLPRLRRPGRRRRGRQRDHRSHPCLEGRRSPGPAGGPARRWPASRACTSRRSTSPPTCPTAGSRPPVRSTPPRPRGSRSAPSPISGEWPYPKQQLVPLTEVVHDRLNVEVFRGCTRGCRFCQAGMITRPVRERPAEQVSEMVRQGLRRTGYDEVALTSLSTADFSGIEDVVGAAMDDEVGCGNVSVSLPSLRVDAFTVGVAAQIQRARRTGLTFAPEAGTWRMRQVINKLITEEDLYAAVDSAFSQGWRRVKLYFLTGLPTETDEDTLGIVELAQRCLELAKAKGHKGSVTVSVGGFVPKAFTPFQWFGHEHRGGAAPQDQPPARRSAPQEGQQRAAQVARPEGQPRRGPRQPRRPPARRGHRAGLARGRDVPGVERALPARALAEGDGRPRPRHGLVLPPPPHRGRGPALGPPLGRPAQGLPLAGLAATRSTRSASRTAAGPPATTAAPAPATGSSTSSPPPSRRPEAARAPARTCSAGGEVPVALLPRRPAGVGA